jgi:hypothetical protein
MKKYVFIIDLDSTIIGDCSYQLQLYNIAKIMNNGNRQLININKILSSYYNEKSKLVRPFFVYFINKMRELYKQDVYFYVYTASSKDWANLQIKLIEKENNIKLSRPIFTREECKEFKNKKLQTYSKSIDPLLDKIKPKNPEIIIIDDSDVYTDFKHVQIQCKPYNYTSFCEIYQVLPGTMQNDLGKGMICPYNKDNCTISNKLKLYKWLYNKCREINKNNKKFKLDKFWLNLANAIETNKITDFNANIIKQLTTISNS